MINKKAKGLIKETDGGLGRYSFLRGAAVWIPVALFVLLVLFQMVPLPAGVLKIVSPATYELYEEMLPEVGGRLATDPHRLTPVRFSEPTGQAQTFVRRTPVPSPGATPVKYASLLIGMNFTRQAGQASPDKNGHRFAKRQKSEVKEKDEHRTSNIERPTSNGKMKLKTEERGKDEHRTSNIERPTSNWKTRLAGRP